MTSRPSAKNASSSAIEENRAAYICGEYNQMSIAYMKATFMVIRQFNIISFIISIDDESVKSQNSVIRAKESVAHFEIINMHVILRSEAFEGSP